MPTWTLAHADNFDTVNADIAGRALTTGGQTWAALAGNTGAISSGDTNLAKNVGATTNHYHVSGMTALATVKVEFKRKGLQTGVIWRVADNGNYYMVYTAGAPEKIQFFKRVAGTFTLLTLGTTTIADNDIITVESVGSTHDFAINGTPEFSTSDSAHSAAGTAGLYADGANQYMDEFKVYSDGGGRARLVGGGLVGGGKLLHSRLASGRRRGDR